MSLSKLLATSDINRSEPKAIGIQTYHCEIVRPTDVFKAKRESRGSLQVLRVSTFYNTDNIYLQGFVSDGTIARNMKASINNQNLEILSIDCKFAENVECVGKGYQIFITTAGADADFIKKGQVLEFSE